MASMDRLPLDDPRHFLAKVKALPGLTGSQEQVETLQEINERLRLELQARDHLLATLREVFFPEFRALQLLFDIAPIGEGAGVVVPDREYWENWKANLRGKAADFIDALLTQGPSTAKQLKRLTRSGTSTVPQIIHKLKSLGLIEKNGSLYSLKKKP